MHELHLILDAWRGLRNAKESGVLATVVHVTGSAYRRPGARMLITPDQRRVGSVSGGCLEGEIAKKAWWFTESREAALRVYDTSSDEEAAWEFGLGCNGVVSVLLERSDSAEASELLGFLDEQRVKREAAVAATVISEGPWLGKKLLISGERVVGGGLAGSALEKQLLGHAGQVADRRKSRLARLDAADVFVEYVGPPQSLVIFGAGHDAAPLVTIAGQLGWDITVVDGRPAYARAERFPEAQRVVVLKWPDFLREAAIGRETAVVLMTHNFPLDARLLPAVLAARPAYVGMLGPRSRAERLLNGMTIPDDVKVHAPIGLDLGGDTPAVTALAIAAEVQAALAGRRGGMLSEGTGMIHSPVDEAGSSGLRAVRRADRRVACETLVGNYA